MIWSPKFKIGYVTMTTPLVIRRLRLAMANRCTIFEASTSSLFEVVRGHSKSLK